MNVGIVTQALMGATLHKWAGLRRKVSARDVPLVSPTDPGLLWEQQEWNAEVIRKKAMRHLRRLHARGLHMPEESLRSAKPQEGASPK